MRLALVWMVEFFFFRFVFGLLRPFSPSHTYIRSVFVYIAGFLRGAVHVKREKPSTFHLSSTRVELRLVTLTALLIPTLSPPRKLYTPRLGMPFFYLSCSLCEPHTHATLSGSPDCSCFLLYGELYDEIQLPHLVPHPEIPPNIQ